jgi:hypothetical protein
MYNIHHCGGVANPYTNGGGPSPSPYSPYQTYNTQDVLTGAACYFPNDPVADHCWGHRQGNHFAKPQAALGFYCQADPNPTPPDGRASAATIYNLHATEMRDAGIDFVIVNFGTRDVNSADAQYQLKPAYEQMRQHWPSDGPKIVPFRSRPRQARVTSWRSTISSKPAPRRMDRGSSGYMYEGKLLVLVKFGDDGDFPNADRLASLAAPNGWSSTGLTVRKMWARYQFAAPAFINSLPISTVCGHIPSNASPDTPGIPIGRAIRCISPMAGRGKKCRSSRRMETAPCRERPCAWELLGKSSGLCDPEPRRQDLLLRQLQMVYWWRWGASSAATCAAEGGRHRRLEWVDEPARMLRYHWRSDRELH